MKIGGFKPLCVSLVLSAMSLQVLSIGAFAQFRGSEEKAADTVVEKPDVQEDFAPKKKISPDLEEKADEAFHGMRAGRARQRRCSCR